MIIEHRRHSLRDAPNPHLNTEGVRVARVLGETMGDFDYVMASISPRAIETAVAMGYAVDETIDFSTTVQNLPDGGEELPEGTPFSTYSQKFRNHEYFKAWGNKVKDLLVSHISKLTNKEKILIVSHAGIIEVSTSAFFEGEDLNHLGKGVNICEGVRFEFDGKSCSSLEKLEL